MIIFIQLVKIIKLDGGVFSICRRRTETELLKLDEWPPRRATGGQWLGLGFTLNILTSRLKSGMHSAHVIEISPNNTRHKQSVYRLEYRLNSATTPFHGAESHLAISSGAGLRAGWEPYLRLHGSKSSSGSLAPMDTTFGFGSSSTALAP